MDSDGYNEVLSYNNIIMLESTTNKEQMLDKNPNLKKILKQLSRDFQSQDEKWFFEQIKNIATYIDNWVLDFKQEGKNIFDRLQWDRENDNLIKKCFYDMPDDVLLAQKRFHLINKHLSKVDVYRETNMFLWLQLTDIVHQNQELQNSNEPSAVKQLSINKAMQNRLKAKVKANDDKIKWRETTMYVLRLAKRYLNARYDFDNIKMT